MKNQKGQTLVESLIALAVAVVIVSAIVVSVISSLSNAQYTKNQNLANQYASQGMEVVRGIRNTSWDTISSYNGDYCLPENQTTLIAKGTGCSPKQNVAGVFLREVNIDHNSPSCDQTLGITVNVSWSDGKCTDSSNSFCHVVSLVSCFGNNNAVPTP